MQNIAACVKTLLDQHNAWLHTATSCTRIVPHWLGSSFVPYVRRFFERLHSAATKNQKAVKNPTTVAKGPALAAR